MERLRDSSCATCDVCGQPLWKTPWNYLFLRSINSARISVLPEIKTDNMWIILSLLLLQMSDSFASYNKGSTRCGAQSGSRGAGTAHSNGGETNTIKHPWAVAFMIEDQVGSGEKRIHCSGSIIDPTHIITAAHCFYPKDEAPIDKSRLTVVLGANDPMDPKDLKRGQTAKIENVEIHDQYNKQHPNAYNDIAIVELTKKIRFKSNIWPVCLPEKTNSNENHLYRQGLLN